jgi:hypothetical protein
MNTPSVTDIEKKKQSDLAELVGGKSRASKIMNRKRPLTLHMIQKINASWKIPAATLITPYHLEANAEGACPPPMVPPRAFAYTGGLGAGVF